VAHPDAAPLHPPGATSEATPEAAASAALAAQYFDGQSARAHPVTLHWSGATLQVRGEAIKLEVAANQLQWSERTRHGPRVAQLTRGGALHCPDARACDAWLRAAGHRDSPVVQVQQSWRWVLASVVAVGLLLAALAVWGIPWFSQVAVRAIPQRIDKELGQSALATIDQHLTQPSALDATRQQRVRDAFARALAAQVEGSVPAHELLFRRGRGKPGLGPNAFALPGGTIVITDELVQLFDAEVDVLSGVLAHELGHVRHRHGMRMVVQASLIGLLSSLVLGDFSGILAAAPVVLGQASYSRAAEREADAHCAQFLKAAGISPAVMVALFEKLGTTRAPPGTSGDAAKQAPPTATEAESWMGIAPRPATRASAPARARPKARQAPRAAACRRSLPDRPAACPPAR
jgi:Zn-dependent protease with chaperone function